MSELTQSEQILFDEATSLQLSRDELILALTHVLAYVDEAGYESEFVGNIPIPDNQSCTDGSWREA